MTHLTLDELDELLDCAHLPASKRVELQSLRAEMVSELVEAATAKADAGAIPTTHVTREELNDLLAAAPRVSIVVQRPTTLH